MAEVAALLVVAQLEVAVSGVARVDLFDRYDLGAAWEGLAVFVEQALDEGDGVGDDAVEMPLNLAEAGADFPHLFFGAVDVVERDAADGDLE